MALTISLLSIKGGVGKTSAAVNLAAQAVIGGLRTLVVDLDPQGGATYTLGVDERVDGGARAIASKDYALKRAIVSTPWLGIDIVPADFSLRHLDLDLAARGKPKRRLGQILRPLRARYDVVLIDSNADLIGCYETVRDTPDDVARILSAYRSALGRVAGGVKDSSLETLIRGTKLQAVFRKP